MKGSEFHITDELPNKYKVNILSPVRFLGEPTALERFLFISQESYAPAIPQATSKNSQGQRFVAPPPPSDF